MQKEFLTVTLPNILNLLEVLQLYYKSLPFLISLTRIACLMIVLSFACLVVSLWAIPFVMEPTEFLQKSRFSLEETIRLSLTQSDLCKHREFLIPSLTAS